MLFKRLILVNPNALRLINFDESKKVPNFD